VAAVLVAGIGLTMEEPGLGIFFFIVAVPIVIRTFVAVSRKETVGRRLTALEKVGVFFTSVGVVAVAGVAAFVAFVAVCFPIGLASLGGVRESGTGMILAFGLGLVAAVVVAVWMLWRLRPR
jgi:hypothetical protein